MSNSARARFPFSRSNIHVCRVACAYINAEISPVRRPSSDSSRVYIYGNLDYGVLRQHRMRRGREEKKTKTKKWFSRVEQMYFKSVGFVDEQRACICVRETTKGENAWRYGEGVNAKINETEISFLIHFSISLFCFPYSPFMREFRSVCERAPRFGNYLLQWGRNYVASADS